MTTQMHDVQTMENPSADPRKIVLETRDLTMQFGGVVAVNNLNMKVYEGEIVALIGPNGAGKTTAFNAITGVYLPTNGEVEINGEVISAGYPTGKMEKLYAGENKGKYKKNVDLTPDKITKKGVARTGSCTALYGGAYDKSRLYRASPSILFFMAVTSTSSRLSTPLVPISCTPRSVRLFLSTTAFISMGSPEK
jgi:energy-coupling factor transporter ATP-binding protein EcfA2